MSIVIVHDCTHQNIGHLPGGQAAGYDTGSGGIAWTNADWSAHPGALHIDQDWKAGDTLSDILDVENGAATNNEAAHWYSVAMSNFLLAKRPGQRKPCIYTSQSNVTALANQLIADGVKSGPHLWIANWNLSDPQAAAEVAAASGPFPIAGVQFTDNQQSGGFYDTSVFSSSYLAEVSRSPVGQGPYRHVLTNRSLHQMAQARHTTPGHLLAVTASAYTDQDAATIIPGMIVYSTNP